jgi:hypothetical protein
MALRIKGQEVAASMVSATVGLETALAHVKSLDIQFDREILSEGYIGQTTEQKDDIFKGVSGTMVIHADTPDAFALIQRINAVSRRRLAGENFRISAIYAFPDGQSRNIVIPNCKFGDIPISSPSRDDYVSITFDFVADEGRILAA